LPEGIKVNVAQALLPVGLSRNCQSGLERSDIQGQHGGEAQFAEPPASGQTTFQDIEAAKAVWSVAT
jgi:hypothetical protein